MNHGWIYRDRVPLAATGQTLLDFYTQRYPHSTRTEWQHRIAAGQVTINGQPQTPDCVLGGGEQLAYHRPPWEEPAVPLAFDVIYEDEDLWAIAKPSGLPVLPGGGFVEHTLLYQLQQRYPQDTPSPVHRLGRGTSGILLVARSPLAKRDLSRQLRQATQRGITQSPPSAAGGFAKTYRALVAASDLPDTFTLTFPIGRVPYPVLGTVYAAHPTGKPAHSEGQVLRRAADHTLLEITIYTGRPHQIRIHLAAAGYPLLHDPFYAAGGKPYPVPEGDWRGQPLPMPGDCGYWLHAHRVQFCHPRTRSPLVLVCPPPPCLQD